MSKSNEPHNATKRQLAVRSIRRYLGRYRGRILVGGACIVVSNALLLVNPWILKLTIDELKQGLAVPHLGLYALVLVGTTVVSGVFRFLMRRIIIGVSRKVEVDIRADYFSHLQSMSPSFYDRNRTGDLMALATNDLNAVRAFAGPAVMYSMNTFIVAAFALSLMIVLSWQLTLVALMPMGLLSVGMYHAMKLIHKYFEKVQESFAMLNSRAQENLSGIRVVRAYAREEREIESFEEIGRDYIAANMKLFKVQALFSPLLTGVAGIGGLLMLAYGGKQVIDGTITLGTFVAFSGYMTMMVWPMISIGWVMNIMERGLASMERINEVLRAEPDIRERTEGLQSLSRSDRSIRFENVSFAYNTAADREPILKNLSFEIGDGETVAIVGPTGSGKTTLVSLILRLYEPQEGCVRLGGVPVSELGLSELRSYIGLIPQDIFLFSQTIADNVAFGVNSLDNAELDRLTSVAAIHGEIQGFPSRYDTMIGERGINFSGGQKQRLAIARALAKDPQILILDDALSSVDTDTEERILSSLRREMKARTSILISHRISTVREADRILVLDDGRLVEYGTHAELVLRGGMYEDMYRKQQIMYNLEQG